VSALLNSSSDYHKDYLFFNSPVGLSVLTVPVFRLPLSPKGVWFAILLTQTLLFWSTLIEFFRLVSEEAILSNSPITVSSTNFCSFSLRGTFRRWFHSAILLHRCFFRPFVLNFPEVIPKIHIFPISIAGCICGFQVFRLPLYSEEFAGLLSCFCRNSTLASFGIISIDYEESV